MGLVWLPISAYGEGAIANSVASILQGGAPIKACIYNTRSSPSFCRQMLQFLCHSRLLALNQ